MSLPKAPNEWCGVHTLLSRRKRAVSELIAALFLIMIAVTVGTAIYLYVMGRSFSITSSTILYRATYEEKVAERLVPVLTAYNATSNVVTVLIYNAGKVPAKICTAYAGLTPSNMTPATLLESPRLIPEDLATLKVKLPFTPQQHTIIYLDLITERGNHVRVEAYS